MYIYRIISLSIIFGFTLDGVTPCITLYNAGLDTENDQSDRCEVLATVIWDNVQYSLSLYGNDEVMKQQLKEQFITDYALDITNEDQVHHMACGLAEVGSLEELVEFLPGDEEETRRQYALFVGEYREHGIHGLRTSARVLKDVGTYLTNHGVDPISANIETARKGMDPDDLDKFLVRMSEEYGEDFLTSYIYMGMPLETPIVIDDWSKFANAFIESKDEMDFVIRMDLDVEEVWGLLQGLAYSVYMTSDEGSQGAKLYLDLMEEAAKLGLLDIQ